MTIDVKIERRNLIKGLAAVPLAAILADPLIARAVAAGRRRFAPKSTTT